LARPACYGSAPALRVKKLGVYPLGAWNVLHGRFIMKRVNHQEAYSLLCACTNGAESFFSRIRRGEVGHHHHIAGAYLARYAQESAWREDHRRDNNGDQVTAVAQLAMRNKPSVDFSGYRQRRSAVKREGPQL